MIWKGVNWEKMLLYTELWELNFTIKGGKTTNNQCNILWVKTFVTKINICRKHPYVRLWFNVVRKFIFSEGIKNQSSRFILKSSDNSVSHSSCSLCNLYYYFKKIKCALSLLWFYFSVLHNLKIIFLLAVPSDSMIGNLDRLS